MCCSWVVTGLGECMVFVVPDTLEGESLSSLGGGVGSVWLC